MSLLLFVGLLGVPVALIYPGWRRANATAPVGVAVLLLPLLGAAIWLAIAMVLSAANVKGVSLSNLSIEVPAVAWASVGIAYIRFMALHPSSRLGAHAGIVTCAALTVVAILVRLVVPELGE